MPATSAPVECVFSQSIISDHTAGARMLNELLEMLMVLKCIALTVDTSSIQRSASVSFTYVHFSVISPWPSRGVVGSFCYTIK